MSTPLFFTSSKPASTEPLAGHIQVMVPSAGNGRTAALAGVSAVAGADETGAAAVVVMDGLVTGLTTTSPSGGGITRNTCPTSIRFGFSMWFQRTTSDGLWPESSAMRVSVSPGLTV